MSARFFHVYLSYVTQNQQVRMVLIYVASRRVRSIVIIEKQSTQQHNTCDYGPSTSTYDPPTTNPLRVGQGH